MATQTATSTETIGLTHFPTSKPTDQTSPQASLPAAPDPGPEHEPPTRTSKATYFKLLSSGFSFFVAGVNDGSIGALLPYVIREYHVSRAIVSSVYGANFFGWLAAALLNTHLCQYLDLGAMLSLGALCQIIAHALRSWDPPFGLFVATFWLVSIGQAFQDTHANTYVAGVGANSHRWLAFIHAMYMAGCLVGPFVSTGVASAGAGASSGHSFWYLFYTFPLGIGVANLAFVAVSFRDSLRFFTRSKPTLSPSEAETDISANDPNSSHPAAESKNKGAMHLIKATASTPSVWLLCIFFFFYIGSVLTASGWVVEYLVDVRHGDLASMGYVPAGFNGGCLLGRLLLAEPTHRFGERRMVFLYCVLAVALQLIFWLYVYRLPLERMLIPWAVLTLTVYQTLLPLLLLLVSWASSLGPCLPQ